MKDVLSDIYKYINWGELSVDYLGKSKSWISRKMRGLSGDDMRYIQLKEEEKERLRSALIELSEKIKEASERV